MARRQKPTPPSQPPTLSPSRGIELLRRQRDKGQELLSKRPVKEDSHQAWEITTQEYLKKCFGSDSGNVTNFPYRDVGIITSGMTEAYFEKNRAEELNRQLKLLDACIEQLEAEVEHAPHDKEEWSLEERPTGNDVFLVHGRDQALRETVARFLERLGLNVTVLHEMPDQGRTVIEKFEHYSNVGFAIVLLTGDDRGGLKETSAAEYQLRARQNVLFELGFFVGRLGRQRVCALREEGVEVPSDYHGVVYVPIDPAGYWKLTLAREMKAAGLPVDLNRAM